MKIKGFWYFLGKLLLIALMINCAIAQEFPTNQWISLYSSLSLFNGQPLPAGIVIDAYDPDSIHCGTFEVTHFGHYGFLHIYGDDKTTPDMDEGAEPGDSIILRIEGNLAITDGPSVPVWNSNGDILEVNLESWSNWPPVVSDIPDQTINEDGIFEEILLDAYVEDRDNIDEELIWEYAGNEELIVSIFEHVVTIIVPDPEWHGMESITFTVTDVGGLSASEVAIFTVNEKNDPPSISQLPELVFNEDDSLLINSSVWEPYIHDPDDSKLLYHIDDGEYISVYADSNLFVFSGPPDWYGEDNLMIIVSDGDLSDSDSIRIRVKPLNDAPYLLEHPDTIEVINTQLLTLEMNSYIDDVDLPRDSLRWKICMSEDSIVWDFDFETCVFSSRISNYVGRVVLFFSVTDDSLASLSDSIIISVRKDPLLVENLFDLPKIFSLSQNFPNPFNPITCIRFTLPERSNVIVEVYNLLGQNIETLVNARKEAGFYMIQYQADKVASGFYVFTIKANSFFQARKMQVVK